MIKFLAINVYHDEMICINVHAGTTLKVLKEKVDEIRIKSAILAFEGKRLWVFFDEFNTTDEVGYIC